MLVQGTKDGNGVLLWLRYEDSVQGGEFPMLGRGDTGAPHGAIVAVRFMIGDAAHGVTLDSGTVSVTPADGLLTARARGSGLDVAGVGRVALEASFDSVVAGSDTAVCQVKL